MVDLVWDGKYDASGKKAPPVSIALPFQTIETVNESTKDRQKSLERFVAGRQPTEWRNRLIWGDKKYVLPSLLPEFENQVDLIYIDPPFDTGQDFSFIAQVHEDEEEDGPAFTKLPSIIEQKAYRDTWGTGSSKLDSYLKWFYETMALLAKLLKPNGVIYIHLDWHVVHYAKAVADEIFGRENFLNEIIWQRFLFHSDAKHFGFVHDNILVYSKGPNYVYKPQFGKWNKQYIESHFQKDTDGRLYTLDNPTAPAHGTTGQPMQFGSRTLYPPKGAMWRWTQDKINELVKAGRIVFTSTGGPRVKRYLDEKIGPTVHSMWTDIPGVNSQAQERVGFPTQKPLALLKRIIEASSNPGDLVLDCFCGSGTTAVAAEQMETGARHWIACDLSRFAIHLTRKRLLEVQTVRPFVIQNLGKYERQAWQAAEFGNEAGARVRAYTTFILNLYSAQPLNGYTWLHGKKGSRLVHVGSVDAPISPLDVGQVVAEFKKAMGGGKEAPRTNGLDILGWDFAFEMNELAKQQAAQANVNIRFVRIPREVLDKRAVEQGDIHFFEMASLDVRLKKSGTKVSLALQDFVIPPDDVPADIQKEISHWSQWIDYWAVDWKNKNDTFHNEVQEFRTKESPKLSTEMSKTYETPGEYRVIVKVIDILGNDTTKMLTVKV